MRLFAAYLKQRVKVLVAFALFCVIFAIIFGLYRLPLGAVIYPAVLCAILGAVFVAFDFASVWRRHKQLCTVKELTAAMITELPDGGDIIGSTGTIGVPEFGTPFTRQMLKDTKPKQFDTLIRLSGFSHGTDVWAGNIHDLIVNGIANVNETVGCRDDIMLYLISVGIEPSLAF